MSRLVVNKRKVNVNIFRSRTVREPSRNSYNFFTIYSYSAFLTKKEMHNYTDWEEILHSSVEMTTLKTIAISFNLTRMFL